MIFAGVACIGWDLKARRRQAFLVLLIRPLSLNPVQATATTNAGQDLASKRSNINHIH